MDFGSVYHFLFGNLCGHWCFGGNMPGGKPYCLRYDEHRTRKQFSNHEKTEDDWSFFDDDEDNDK